MRLDAQTNNRTSAEEAESRPGGLLRTESELNAVWKIVPIFSLRLFTQIAEVRGFAAYATLEMMRLKKPLLDFKQAAISSIAIDFKRFMRFSSISWDFMGLHGFQWPKRRLPLFSWAFQWFHEMSYVSMDLKGPRFTADGWFHRFS